MGLRNPFRIGLRPGTSTLYIGDVGWNTYEEINVAKGGENFGWPCYEGPLTFRNGYANKSACVSQYQTPPTNLSERDELCRLRRENIELRTDTEILRRAAAYFARETTQLIRFRLPLRPGQPGRPAGQADV